MPFTLTMPKLSPTMESGVIAKWHKTEGDQVEPGDLLLEISTDKATVEHSALDGGWLKKILLSEGKEASVNEPIAILTEEENESIEGYEIEKPVATDHSKAQPEIASEEKDTNHPSQKGPATSGMMQPTFAPEPPLENYEYDVAVGLADKRVKASPLAKKLASEQGLDLSTVKGSGPGGRIMRRDLDKAQKAGPVVFGHRDVPKYKPGEYIEETLSPVRKIIAQRLQESKTFIPHFYVTQQVNVKPLEATREQLRNIGVKVTYNDFVIRACALALKEHPIVNSGFNSTNQTIARYQTIDISVAVTIPEGLVTPIIRHADYKNLGEISTEVRSLAKKAKANKLQPHEYKGGSFTISNLGMYGVTNFQAIINPPQAAILAIGGIQNIPVIKDGEVVPGKVMNITLSADHRVVDGVVGAEFIKTVQKYLENPASLTV